jgi:hypothetical protein
MLHLNHGQPGAVAGDCFRCCVASLFDRPAAEVPHFCEDMDHTWHERLVNWLRPWRLFYIETKALPPWLLMPNLHPLVIVSGRSPRGNWGHSVVGEIDRNGWKLIHDPHPSRAGIVGEPEDFGMFVRLTEIAP